MKKFFVWCGTYLIPTFIVGIVVVFCVSFLLDNIPFDNNALDVNMSSEKVVVSNAMLLTDVMGKNLSESTVKLGTTGYVEFEVKSTVKNKVKYEIYLSKENADPEVSMRYVKVYLTDENNKVVEGFADSTVPTFYDLRVSEVDPSGRFLYSGYLKNNGSKKFKLRMWVADTYELTANESIFSVKLNIKVK